MQCFPPTPPALYVQQLTDLTQCTVCMQITWDACSSLESPPKNWPVTSFSGRCLSSLLQFISATAWICISSNCWLSDFSMNAKFSHVCCSLRRCSRVHQLRNLITSNNLTLQRALPPHRNTKIIFFLFFVINQTSSHYTDNTCRRKHNAEFRCKSSLIIWGGRGGRQAIQLILLFFPLFSSLGSVSCSLDTHYKVNSNCAMGHSSETQGYPQAKALSHTLWC